MMVKSARDMSGSGGKLLPVCSICQQVPTAGIRGGMKIKKSFICQSCETEIVNLTVGSAHYAEILDKIKAIIK